MCIRKNDYDKALKIYNEEIKINKELKKVGNIEKLVINESDIIKVLENKINMVFNEDKLNFLDNIKEEINNKLYGVGKYSEEIINLIKNKLLNKEGFLKIYLEGEAYLGKSSLVKIIAESMPKCNFLRIDLNEYRREYDINRLIGTTQGYVGYNDEHLFSKLKNNNFSIILFDNYNVAHSNIKELIKEILKEKYITDSRGEKIYFNNTFIFITNDISKSNRVGFNNKNIFEQNELYDLVDGCITFDKLTKEKLLNYLDKLNVVDKDKIVNNSNYEIFNYKNINKLVKNEKLISS